MKHWPLASYLARILIQFLNCILVNISFRFYQRKLFVTKLFLLNLVLMEFYIYF